MVSTIVIFIIQILFHYIMKRSFELCWIKPNWLEKSFAEIKLISRVVVYSVGLFLAPEMKFCLTIDKYGIKQKH